MATRQQAILVIAAVIILLTATAAVTVSVERKPELIKKWRSQTAGPEPRSQFPVGVLSKPGQPLVFAPIVSGRNGTNCGLIALDGGSGGVVWKAPVKPRNCDANPVTAPTIADFDGDDQREVLVVSRGGQLLAFDPSSGRQELRVRFDTPHGNTRPIVADLTRSPTPDIIVTTVDGDVRVVDPTGNVRWRTSVGGHMFATPRVRDFDADDRPEVVVPAAEGGLVLLDSNGNTVWHRNVSAPTDAVTWMSAAALDDDVPIEIVVGTAEGAIVVVDGRTGVVQWRRSIGRLAAVRAVFDGDSDGVPEIYAVGDRAVLRVLNGTTGVVEWRRTLTNQSVQMTPPPVAGDLNSDASSEIVVVTNDGKLVVLDSNSGEVLTTTAINNTVFAPPTIADIDRDESPEILVLMANGSVIAYDYRNRINVNIGLWTVGEGDPL